MHADANPLDDTLHAYAQAVRRKDVQARAALYDQDVEVFDAWDRWRLQGRDAMRRLASDWFDALGADTVEVSFSQLRVHVARELAAGSVLVTYTAVSAAGERLRSLTNRMNLTLVRGQGDAWRIVHEHTSVPVGFASKLAVPFPAAEGVA